MKTFDKTLYVIKSGFVLGLTLTLLASCSKKPEAGSGSSVVALKVPSIRSASAGKGAVSAMSAFDAIPTNRKACFGITVTAKDLPSLPADSCNPKTGLVAGFVESGGLIQIEVAKGEERTFDLYMYLGAENDPNPCPPMPKRFSSAELAKVYFLGTSGPVSVLKSVEDITITAMFPGLTQTMAAVNQYPSTCTATATPTPAPGPGVSPSHSVSSGAQVSTGGGMQLSGRVAGSGTKMVGGGLRLIAK